MKNNYISAPGESKDKFLVDGKQMEQGRLHDGGGGEHRRSRTLKRGGRGGGNREEDYRSSCFRFGKGRDRGDK